MIFVIMSDYLCLRRNSNSNPSQVMSKHGYEAQCMLFLVQRLMAKCYIKYILQTKRSNILWYPLLWVIIYALGVITTQIQANCCQNMGMKLKVRSFSYNGSLFYIQREVIFCDILWYSLLWVIFYARGIIPTQIQAKWCQNMGYKAQSRVFLV